MVSQEESTLENVSHPTFSYFFKNITRTPQSIIFRNVSDGISSFNQILEFFYNGAIRIRIPINFRTITLPLTEEDSKNSYVNTLYEYLGNSISQYKLVKIANLFLSIRYTTKKYSRFYAENISSHVSKLAMVAEMENTFQLILFVESEIFIEHMEKYHVSTSIYNYKKIPSELNPKRWIELENLDSIDSTIFGIVNQI